MDKDKILNNPMRMKTEVLQTVVLNLKSSEKKIVDEWR